VYPDLPQCFVVGCAVLVCVVLRSVDLRRYHRRTADGHDDGMVYQLRRAWAEAAI